MKRIITAVLLAALALPLVSCGADEAPPEGRNVNEVLRNGLEAKDADTAVTAVAAPEPSGTEAGKKPEKKAEENGSPSSDVDVDLSLMSDVMVYSELYEIIAHSDDYLGKTFRMHGTFAVYEGDGNTYFACLVSDVTACCSQGLEFVLADGSLVYPDDYPGVGAEITVSGVFDTYREGQYSYCRLVDAVIEN